MIKSQLVVIKIAFISKIILFPFLYRYLFLAEPWANRVQRMNLANNNIVTLANSRYPWALSLDYTKKRVYWVSLFNLNIFSSGYDGKKTTTVQIGLFNCFLLGIIEDSVYFQQWNDHYINEMNITSGIISRSIKVDRTDYRDLAIVHTSLQPMGELQKSYQYSWVLCDVMYLIMSTICTETQPLVTQVQHTC